MYIQSSDIVRVLDELSRADLQRLRDATFNWLLCFAAFVVFGILLEGPELVHETRNLFIRDERKKARWITVIGLLGWIIVLLGVAGEGVSEEFVSIADSNLQTFNNIVLADAQRRAGEANKAAEEERSARITAQLELEKFLANRLFENDPRERFGVLKSKPSSKAEVWYMKYDGRAYVFATLVIQSLKEHKWEITGPIPVERSPLAVVPFLRGDAPIIGTYLVSKTPLPIEDMFLGPKAKNIGGLLFWAVGASGGGVDPKLPEDTFRVIIGQRSPTLP